MKAEKEKQIRHTSLWVLLLAVLAFLCLSGCALWNLPENVERGANAAEKAANNTNALVKQTVTDPGVRAGWTAENNRLNAEKKNREAQDTSWLEWLASLAGSLPGFYGIGAAGILGIFLKWYQARQAEKKAQAAYDAVDIVFAQVPEKNQEPLKENMRALAKARGVHLAIKRDLKKRRA